MTLAASYFSKYWVTIKKGVSAACQPAKAQTTVFFYGVKGLGLVWCIAFASLTVQFAGLYGPQGILPIQESIAYINAQQIQWWELPHVFIVPETWWIQTLLWVGCAASIALVCGLFPLLSAGMCWIIYLSFVNVGSVFMSFQWDVLLLEVTILLMLGMPWVGVWRKKEGWAPPRWVMMAVTLCCIRLMVMSGAVKILSGDALWREFSALDIHYWTQPIPHLLSWFVHQLPAWVDRISVGILFGIELILPWFLVGTQRMKQIAVMGMIGLMVLIILTGNYGFFNVLGCVLIGLNCSDHWFKKESIPQPVKAVNGPRVRSVVALVLIVAAISLELSRVMPQSPMLRAIHQPFHVLRPFHMINGYGLFASMTTQRNEIEVWASVDGQTWDTYQFKYKPNHKTDRPKWTVFHQPRLDWQLWFVALRPYTGYGWIHSLAQQLFNQSADVEALFDAVPFQEPPHYIVFMKRAHRFSSWSEWKQTGQWWIVAEAEPYSPVFQNRSVQERY